MQDKEWIERLVNEMPIRMANLKKYYPYFEIKNLNNTSPKYEKFNFEIILLGIVGFLLQEVEVKQRKVVYSDIKQFIKLYTERIYEGVSWDDISIQEFTDYILNKIQNNGVPFEYGIYNLKNSKTEEHYVRYIMFTHDEKDDKNYYGLTAEGIEFYLQTKEFGEESKVTIHLLLLQKMIENDDYDSALSHIINVNAEVRSIILKKREILEEFLTKGIGAYGEYEKYKERINRKFEEENDLFNATTEKVDKMLELKSDAKAEAISKKDRNAINVLKEIQNELKRTVEVHSKLLNEILDLDKNKEIILAEKRANSFKEKFNFGNFLQGIVNQNDVTIFEHAVRPLFFAKKIKFFAEEKIEDMVLIEEKIKKTEKNQSAYMGIPKDLITLDKMVIGRLVSSYKVYIDFLFTYILEKDEFTVKEFVEYIKENHSEKFVKNKDFHTFLVHFFSSASYYDATDSVKLIALCLQELMKFYDLHKCLHEYNKHEPQKDSEDVAMSVQDVVAEVIMGSDKYNDLKDMLIQVYPLLEEDVIVDDTQGQSSKITNYIIKKVNNDEYR